MTDMQERGPISSLVGLSWRFLAWVGRLVRGEVVKHVGGPARARVIVLFAAVLALSGADAATVGAVAPQLESSLHINNTDLGLLSSVSLLVGAIFTLPIGLLVDRTRRMPLLAASIVLWSIASLFSAFAAGFWGLLLTRVALGAVAASAGPAVASLTGDYFAAEERARVWSYILVGEAAGTAFGFIVSGFVASAIGWRAAFVVLAIPGFFVARELWRTVPEPLRGGQSHLEVGRRRPRGDGRAAGVGRRSRRGRGRGPGTRPRRWARGCARGRAERRRGPEPASSCCMRTPARCRWRGRSATSSRSRPTP